VDKKLQSGYLIVELHKLSAVKLALTNNILGFSDIYSGPAELNTNIDIRHREFGK
jgi:hypothetical protein